MRRLGRLATVAGLAVYGVRTWVVAGGLGASSPGPALAGPWDPAGTWSLPLSAAAALLPPVAAGGVGVVAAVVGVLGMGWAGRRLARLAGGGDGVGVVAGMLPGVLLPTAAPLGHVAPLLLAAFALAGLAGAVAAHLEQGGAMVLLELMLWSDLLALCSPDWIWVAIALCIALVPLVNGRGRGRVEAPLAVLVAGGAWAFILRALVENGLGIVDRPPAGDLGSWVLAVLGISATIVLVVALTLLVTGKSDYGLTVALAVTGLAALIDVAVPGISAPAGLAAVAVLPAFGFLAWRAFSPSIDSAALEGGR